MALEPGQIIDAKYRVVRRIGEGGMGTVYEGENSRIGRRVAIKVLHAEVAAMPDFVERFEREARAAARIGSPHVCDVLDLGDLPSGDRYIVMEYLDGVSFEDRLVECGKLTPAQLAPIAFELLEGLGTMHVARVIHRDLKPANVFLARTSGGRGEVVKILDFGVAKLLPFGGEVGTMTQTGTMMGTPLYMSPEQARGARDVDARTDIYAASVMFYRALTGVLPYNAETLNELLFKIVLEDPKPLREVAPEVDEVFAAIVHKGLAREVTQRFQNARAFQDEIAAWGKTQGRTSLSFAATHASEASPLTPVTLPDPSLQVANAISASGTVAGGSAASVAPGTPIAWSEAAPGHPSSAKMVAASVLAPISAQAQAQALPVARAGGGPSAVGALPPASAGSAAPSSSTLSSSSSSGFSTSGASKGDGLVIADARTAPTMPLADVVPPPAPRVTNAATKSPRGLIVGIVTAGAVAVVAIIAFGRGGPEKLGPSGLTSTASPPSSAALAPIDSSANAAKAPPPPAPDIASATAIGTAAASATAATDGATAAPPPPASAETSLATRKDPSAPPASPRKPDATAATAAKVPPATATSTQATTAAAPTATATATSSASARPAASARKFRTNLD